MPLSNLVGPSQHRIRAQRIPKGQMAQDLAVSVMPAMGLNEALTARRAETAAIASPRQAVFAQPLVTHAMDNWLQAVEIDTPGNDRDQVDDRFGRKPGYRGRSDMVHLHQCSAERGLPAFGFLGREAFPSRII